MTDDSAQVGDFDIYVEDYLHKTFGRAKPRKGRRIAQAQDWSWRLRSNDTVHFRSRGFFQLQWSLWEIEDTHTSYAQYSANYTWAGTKAFAHCCGVSVPRMTYAVLRSAERDNHSDLLSVALGTELCCDVATGAWRTYTSICWTNHSWTHDICAGIEVEQKTDLQKVTLSLR